jgi:hypothetical protein
MNLDILKNPVIFGLLFSLLTYAILLWHNKKYNNKNKDKKPKEVNLIIPALVGVAVTIVSYNYLSDIHNNNSLNHNNINLNQNTKYKFFNPKDTKYKFSNPMDTKYKFSNNAVQSNYKLRDLTSESPASYQLISKGLNIPNKIDLPDVFIETY